MENLATILAKAQIAQRSSANIIWNDQQAEAIKLSLRGESVVICGAAGSGKTTVSSHIVSRLWDSAQQKIQRSSRWLRAGDPAIVVVSFTNRAASNFRKLLKRPEIPVVTIHKLLEYRPIAPNSMVFAPTFDRNYPLPQLQTIIIEEASLVSTELFEVLWNAVGDNVQWIILGDIQQLTPPIGKSIFRAVLAGNKFKKVELSRVYRQAGGSPILESATNICQGISLAFGKEENENGALTIAPFPKGGIEDAHAGLQYAIAGMKARWKSGRYNPDEDIVIVPFRDDKKSSEFTSNHLAKAVATFIDDALGREVFTIQCGPQRLFFAKGDRVMYNREDAKIINIRPNPGFYGFIEPPNGTIDRYGMPKAVTLEFPKTEEWDFLPMASEGESEDEGGGEEKFFSQSSHFVKLEFPDGEQVELDAASEIRKLSLAYATTAYAVQGLQATRVFIFLHNEHARRACNRETIYTAMTRAQKECVIVCDPKFLTRGVQSQLIPGNTLEEKIKHITLDQTSMTLAERFGF